MIFCSIKNNNFIDNNPNANFINLWLSTWDGNYWDDWDGNGSYTINGLIFSTPWTHSDRNPAKEPYDIPIP